MKKHTNTLQPTSQQGFTLIELSIVLIIFGLLMSTVALSMKRYRVNLQRESTITAVERSQDAIFAHQLEFEKYPCPADPTLAPGNAMYGRSNCTSPNLITVRGRDIDNADGDNNPCTGGDFDVLIGAVPVNTILDPDNNITTPDSAVTDEYGREWYSAAKHIDGWANKLTYAVTRDLTDHPAAPAEFDHEMGAICIVDENNESILNEPASAHVALISHGINGKGSYNEQGIYVDDCVDIADPADVINATAKLPKDEIENCDHEAPAVADATFLKGVYNENENDYNDDVVKFIVSTESSLWAYNNLIWMDNGTPLDPTDDFTIAQIVNTNGGNIGIGVDDPVEQLHIQGDMQAFKMQIESLCDNAGADCLPPEIIAGEVADMKCPAGQVVTKIEMNKVFCANPFPATSYGGCPAGTVLTGISNISGPICNIMP